MLVLTQVPAIFIPLQAQLPMSTILRRRTILSERTIMLSTAIPATSALKSMMKSKMICTSEILSSALTVVPPVSKCQMIIRASTGKNISNIGSHPCAAKWSMPF